ncbi:hypothetical protein H5410_052358 [Solanum commersonii]|uniref:Uncharacterized protein n=1 Tax=Solanum commersonii TaxID=4109 RepID=A0A9J5X0W8_SOLCO|nr:hypothetical protein H5410_052358 [Solanum commersonii]
MARLLEHSINGGSIRENDSEDEENRRDTHSENEDDDPLALPICARDVSNKSYDLATWMDERGSFPANISIRARMVVNCDFRKLLI